jgi:hypothetical protein
METVNDRISFLVESKERGNNRAFGKKLGQLPQVVGAIRKGRNKPSFEFLTAILEHFPEIDPLWLILGKGEYQEIEEKEKEKNLVEQNELLKRNNEMLIENNKALMIDKERLWKIVETNLLGK